ncbi:MAG: efflux RND transporter permease subunit [Paraprevotella sp.]|nr:efflux RND transporter permease subunit [Paraprevotella sp.]
MKGNIFIKRPVMAMSISILILIVGFISLGTLPIERYPDIAPPTVRVSATYTGASTDAVMKSVIQPLEESINGVENMTYMQSTATNSGSADISIYFKQGTDPDMAAVNVQNRVTKAQGLLPAEVTQIGVTTQKRQTSFLQIGALYSPNNRYDKTFLSNYLDINVVPRIKRIEGVGDVTSMGDTYSLRIWLKPDVMAQYGLVPSDITAVLGEQNLESPTGALGENSQNTFQFTMKYKGRLTEVSQFENMIVRSLPDGNVLRVKDVARVELGTQSYSFEGTLDGHPSCQFMVYQVAGSNATEVNNNITALLDDMSKDLPEGTKFMTMMSSNDFLFASIHEVVETLIIAIILVILVVYFFLQDFKSTLIPSISIIVSLVGTFAAMKIAGFSINILTLFALVLVIGTVVDDSIVVVEAVQAKFDVGYKSPYQATKDALSDVTMAVFSCTLVFMAVFIPVTFMGGTSGIFYTQFGVTMAVAVGISCLNALTLCPALCAMWMRPASGTKGKRSINGIVKAAYNASFKAMVGKYKTGVMFFIHHRWISWATLVVSCVLLVYFIKTTKTALVPQEDQGVMMVNVGTAPGSSLASTDKAMSKIEKIIQQIPEIEHYTKVSGYGLMSGQGTSYGLFIIRLKDWDERKGKGQDANSLINKLNFMLQSVKEAQAFTFQPGMIPGYGMGNSIELQLQDHVGGDLTTFYQNTMKFIGVLNLRPEISMAYTTFNPSFPIYNVDVDAAKCKRAGISPSDVLSTLGGYCGGIYASNFNLFSKVYRVMIQGDPQYRLDQKSLDNIFVRVNGEMAPISQFLTVQKGMGPEITNRFNLFDAITCNINPADGYSTGQAMQAIEEVFSQTMPSRYQYEFGSISREEQATTGSNDTVFIYAICVVLIFLILSCLYESFLVPLAVILSVPCGLMGSFLFAKILGLENNIYLQTGVIMLIGLLSKTAILITEFASERRRQGMGIVEAAYSAAQARFRPILMTVLTMIFGMLPLMFATGAGANGNSSLGTGVVGGMLIGTLALLFVTPVFFIVIQFLQEKIRPPMHEEANAQVLAERERIMEERNALKSETDKQ